MKHIRIEAFPIKVIQYVYQFCLLTLNSGGTTQLQEKFMQKWLVAENLSGCRGGLLNSEPKV